jgi:hypothetical protein
VQPDHNNLLVPGKPYREAVPVAYADHTGWAS